LKKSRTSGIALSILFFCRMSSHHAVTTDRIKTIVAESFNDDIDEPTTEAIAELMDKMLESIVDWSVKVADRKGTNVLDVDDVRFIAEQEWGVSLKDQPTTSSTRK
jgi:transcription initiation factor TFIID subunit TAF12